MGQAVKNLLRNACRYAIKRIVVEGWCQEGEARIVVADDGMGIPEADQERIFQSFAWLDAARDRESGGVGLGLAIVRQITRWHGGKVWVEGGSSGGLFYHRLARDLRPVAAKRIKGRDERFFLRLKGAE
jgi:signal transduction histidine kinase